MNPLFRASAWTLADGTAIRTCSAEDLVVFKAFAARDQDWLDVQGVTLRKAWAVETGSATPKGPRHPWRRVVA